MLFWPKEFIPSTDIKTDTKFVVSENVWAAAEYENALEKWQQMHKAEP